LSLLALDVPDSELSQNPKKEWIIEIRNWLDSLDLEPGVRPADLWRSLHHALRRDYTQVSPLAVDNVLPFHKRRWNGEALIRTKV
jgi:hypothetical protein